MSKIQQALAELESARTPAAATTPIEPAQLKHQQSQVTDGESPRSELRNAYDYGGRQVHIDVDELASHTLLPPKSCARQTSKEFKSIKRPLLKNVGAMDPQLPRSNMWLVTSSLAGEGKSFCSINLAMSVAQEKDWSVVLVDADCGKPHLTTLLSADNDPGLMDLLRDPGLKFESVVMPTDIPGLSVLPVGRLDDHAAELLASERMTELCSQLAGAESRRILIFDSSPILLTVESTALAAQVGQVILVVRAHKTSRNAVHDAYHRLDPSIPVNLLLTHADVHDGRNAYGGYLGYGATE